MSTLWPLGAVIVATVAVAFIGNRKARARRRHGQRVAVIGDLVCQTILNGVDEVPQWGETCQVFSGPSMIVGGSAGNAAIWMHALSTKLKVRILDTTGTSLGQIRSLVTDGIYASHVKLVPPLVPKAWSTGQVVSLANSEGRKTHVRFSGGNDEFKLKDFRFESIVHAGTVHVHIGGFFNCSGLVDGLEEFISRSKKSGVKHISFHPQLARASKTSPLSIKHVRDKINLVDFFICNELEAMMLVSGALDLVEAVMEIAATCRCVVVTLGSEGALLMRQCIDLRPLRILCKDVLEVPIVDTIGVGDAFGAGFIHEVVARNLTPESPGIVEAVRYGCACGTAACTVLGGSTFPGLDRVRACLID